MMLDQENEFYENFFIKLKPPVNNYMIPHTNIPL